MISKTSAGKQKKLLKKPIFICPECKEGHLIIRFGKAGPFAGCDRYPACTFTSNFERQPDGSVKLVKTAAPKVLEETCPALRKTTS